MPYLSHSQCETWNQCPRRWQLQKIEGAPQAPSEALILGSAIHAVIEADGRNLRHEFEQDADSLEALFDVALQKALAEDDPEGLILQDTIADMYRKGQAIIIAYQNYFRPRYLPLAVEESFEVEIPGAPGWRFIGRIDARARMSDGSLAIIDFKSGKAWEQGAEHGKPQASAYLMAESMRQPLQQAQAICFVIFPVESDGNGGYTCRPQFRVTTRTNAQVDNYAQSLVAITQSITAAKQSGNFPVKTGPLCGWCGVLGSCQDGQAWLASKGRTPAVPVVSRQRDEGGKSA